jgi:hypothetical protein
LGATLAVILGLVVWIGLELSNPDGVMPPQLAGLIASFTGMVAGSLVPGTIAREAASR